MSSAPATRPRNAAATREAILAAAQLAFAREGYAASGIREIAAKAGISSALLIRYFGSKAGLFEAALTRSMQSDLLMTVPREAFGAFLLRQFRRPEVMIFPPALIALAAGDAEAAPIAARVAEEYAIAPLAAWLGGTDARARALEIFMLSTSFVLYSRQIPLVGPGGEDGLDAWFVQSVQAVVDAV
jgi:AcrR family transcriptional regulator